MGILACRGNIIWPLKINDGLRREKAVGCRNMLVVLRSSEWMVIVLRERAVGVKVDEKKRHQQFWEEVSWGGRRKCRVGKKQQ